MKVLLIGHIKNEVESAIHCGYANAVSGILEVLQKMKKEGKIDLVDAIDSNDVQHMLNNPKEYDFSFSFVHPSSFLNPDVLIMFCNALRKIKYNFLNVVWETQPLPADWGNILNSNLFVGVSTPSKFILEQLTKVTTKPCYYLPHHINPEAFGRINIADKMNEKTFNCLFVGQYTPRKGMEEAIIGFARAVGEKPEARLNLKYHYMSKFDIPIDMMIKTKIMSNCRAFKAAVYILNEKVDFQKIIRLYQNSSLVLNTSRAEGFGLPCHPAGTLVLSNTGVIPIESVKENNIVYTHKGILQKVSGVTVRNFCGEMFKVTTQAQLELLLTEKHKLYSVPLNKRFTYLKEKDLIPSWNKVEDLKIGDLVTVPKIKKEKGINVLKITDYVKDLKESGEFVYCKMSRVTGNKVSLSFIAKKANCSFQTVHEVFSKRTTLNSELGVKIKKLLEKYKYSTPEPLMIRNKIELSKEVMEFFGLYVAEGSCFPNGCGISLAFHKNEIDNHKLVEKVCKNLFGNAKVSKRIRGNGLEITISSKIVCKLFENLFGAGAKNKKIPKEFFNSKNIGSLICGYFKGDGCLRGQIVATTVSPILAYNIFHILNQENILVSLHKMKKRKNGNYPEYLIRVYEQYLEIFKRFTGLTIKNHKINKTKRKHVFVLENKDYFFVPIRDIGKIQNTSCKVYNLHVENDESYIANGYSSHNCAESMCVGIPSIYTNWSSLPEVSEAPGNIPIEYHLDSAYSMVNHGYSLDSFYAIPSICSVTEAIKTKYTKWKSDRKAYYEETQDNYKIVENKFGYKAVKGWFEKIFEGTNK